MTLIAISATTRYRCIGWCLAPAVFLHMIWRSSRDGGLIYFKQRLGFAVPSTENAIWFHAASVGEINTLTPLLVLIRRQHPATPLLVTTNTPTGKQALSRQGIIGLTHCYLPLDYPSIVSRFAHRNQYQCGIIVETEIWPTLYRVMQTPLIIINGRLSDRTLRFSHGLLAPVFHEALAHITKVFARSDSDSEKFIQLGLSPDKVTTLGNLKFAHENKPTGQSPDLVTRPYCLLASTHANEEHELAAEWLKYNRSELLVIAPRHPERRGKIKQQLLSLTANVLLRSSGIQPDRSTQIYLADTFGEMDSWYQYANAIFMGGSLGPTGGHNLLEPARLGKPVVIGPNYKNFVDEVKIFQDKNAVVVSSTPAEVVENLVAWLDAPADAHTSGKSAQQIVERRKGISMAYLSALQPWVS